MSELISVTGRSVRQQQIHSAATQLEAMHFRVALPDFSLQGQAAVSGDMQQAAAYFNARLESLRQADALLVADDLQEVRPYDATVAVPSILGEMAAAAALDKPVLLQYKKPRDQALFAALSLSSPYVLDGDLSRIRSYLKQESKG